MRLINTSSLEVVDYIGDAIPPYAILSHTWNKSEMNYQNILHSDRSTLPGFAKVQRCCQQAQADGWEWAWIDSCCIDKTSSAELSEAINSMFQWYRESEICYAFLEDVSADFVSERAEAEQQFVKARWFTRGWTLQELLAPRHLLFFDCDWNPIGPRDDWEVEPSFSSLSALIRSATGILHLTDYNNASVACKMSWAAKRSTTRIEDRAYSLMGLFGVNMPPLYGEGPRAFYRLQLEILREVDDDSIFAWSDGEDLTGGLLASSVSAFENSGRVEKVDIVSGVSGSHARPPSSITSRGLQFHGRPLHNAMNSTMMMHGTNFPVSVVIPIYCRNMSKSTNLMAIHLTRISDARCQWVRMHSEDLHTLKALENAEVHLGNMGGWQSFYVKQLGRYESPFQGPFKIRLESLGGTARGFQYHDHMVQDDTLMAGLYSTTPTAAGLYFSISRLRMFGLTAAFLFQDESYSEWVFLILNIHDFRISIRLLGPYDTAEKTEKVSIRRKGLNWAIFDDYFALPDWEVRTRRDICENFSGGRTLKVDLHRMLGLSEDDHGYAIHASLHAST